MVRPAFIALASAAFISGANLRLFDALLPTIAEDFAVAPTVASVVVTAFTLAATALGVATIPQAAIAAYAPQVREHLGIGQDRLILCAISFGYADPDHPANQFRTERAPTVDIIDWKS